MKKAKGLFSLDENAEMALAFYLLIKKLDTNKEKILSFSRLLWPLLSIQGVIQTHILLDGIMIFAKKGKFTNPPRQPLIGHILRNVDERTEIELLERIIDVLTYKDAGAEEIGAGEESEFRTLKVDGLVNPEHLQSILKLIPHLEYLPITRFVPLDTTLNTEIALDVSEKYRSYIETMNGNAYRWEGQIKLIGDSITKWMTNLNVELKDLDLRYSSQIAKTRDIIDNVQLKKQIELEHDKIDQWNVNEKKNIIENISILFKTAERQLQEIIKKNKFFSDDDSLKSKIFEDLIPQFDNHFTYLKNEGHKFITSVESLYQKFNELIDQAKRVDSEATEKLENVTKELSKKLDDRNTKISEFEKEKEEELSKLNEFKTKIEDLFNTINEIIKKKMDYCQQESDNLTSWSIKDTEDELFSKPIQWIYMPFYVIFKENEELMEEKMDLVFPGYIGEDPNSLYEDISDSFIEFHNLVEETVDEDMKIRSNFEFSSDSKNLFKDPNFKTQIQEGIAILKNKKLFNDEIEAQILKILP